MTAADLRKASLAHRRAVERTEDTQVALHQTIRKHHAEGWTMRAIASEVGLSFQRIAQILKAD